MGRQADLCWMLGAPSELECPWCGQTFSTYFDDYDIDGPCNPEPGVWKLRCQCPHCDEEGREVVAVVELQIQPSAATTRWTPAKSPVAAPESPQEPVPGTERVSGPLDRPGPLEGS